MRTPENFACQSARSSSVILRKRFSGTSKPWPGARARIAAWMSEGQAIVTAHGLHHRRGGIRDEGGGQDRVDADQVQGEADDGLRLFGVRLDDRPWGGGLQVFVADHPDRAEFVGGLADLHLGHELGVVGDPRAEVGDEGGLQGPKPPPAGTSVPNLDTANLVTRETRLPRTSARSLLTEVWKFSQVNSLSEILARGTEATSASSRRAGSTGPGP